ELGREIVGGPDGDKASLRVIRSPPSARPANVASDGSVLSVLVRDPACRGSAAENVRQRWRACSLDASGAPGLGLPGGQRSVLLGGHADLGEKRGSGAGDQHFGVALEHQLYGLTARVLGGPRPLKAPATDLNLPAKPGPNRSQERRE